jgi:hypothetical protein
LDRTRAGRGGRLEQAGSNMAVVSSVMVSAAAERASVHVAPALPHWLRARIRRLEHDLKTRPVRLVVLAPPLDVALGRDRSSPSRTVGHLWRHLDELLRRSDGPRSPPRRRRFASRAWGRAGRSASWRRQTEGRLAAGGGGASQIPAGFTYLGQFVDHDLSFDKTNVMLGANVSPTELLQARPARPLVRKPALELDHRARKVRTRDPITVRPGSDGANRISKSGRCPRVRSA